MSKKREVKSEKFAETLWNAAIILCCVAMALLSFLDIRYVENERRNKVIYATVPQLLGIVAVVGMLIKGKYRNIGVCSILKNEFIMKNRCLQEK